jgi:hypothetical protein
MRKLGMIISLVGVVTVFMGFHAKPASALICCSVCDEDPHNIACRHGCSPSCAVDDSVPGDVAIEDDVAKVCYLPS